MKVFITFFFCVVALAGHSQTLSASVKDLAFIKGKWFVNHPWGDMEEYWSEPMGDNMISSFRCVKNRKVVFYEFVVIEQSDKIPVMILRHFNAGSIAWEDKSTPDRYPLSSLSGNKAVFTNSTGKITLSYELVSADKLDVILEEPDKAGKRVKTEFHYSRVK